LAVSAELLAGGTERGRDHLITFPAGLIGLPQMKHFLLADEGRRPWMRLESLDEPRLAFTVVDPRSLRPEYRPPVEPAVLETTGSFSPAEVAFFVLAVEGPGGPETVNLLAPLAVNVARRLGVQVVLDPAEYPLRYLVRS
jgi:flagellar assembly factor FliW